MTRQPLWVILYQRKGEKKFVCVEVLQPSQPNGGHVECGQFT